MNSLCPVCNYKTVFFGHALYKDERGKFQTPLMYCCRCDLFKRIITDNSLKSHTDIAGYSNKKIDSNWLRMRQGFLKYILNIAVDEINIQRYKNPALLDLGSAYGHLLELAKERGFTPIGVEINEYLMKHTKAKGLDIHRNIRDVKGKVDVVTMIDSLYYFQYPLDLFADVRQILDENGILIIRITNRNWLLKVKKKCFISEEFNDLLGDVTIGYSIRSLSLLLEKTDFVLSKIIFHEKGKEMTFKKRVLYDCASLISSISKSWISISPGIIVIARKRYGV